MKSERASERSTFDLQRRRHGGIGYGASGARQCRRILFAFKVKFVPGQGHRCMRQADERKGVCVATYSLRIEVSCKGKHFDEVEGQERGKKLKRRRSRGEMGKTNLRRRRRCARWHGGGLGVCECRILANSRNTFAFICARRRSRKRVASEQRAERE